jgi:hypothetical protein
MYLYTYWVSTLLYWDIVLGCPIFVSISKNKDLPNQDSNMHDIENDFVSFDSSITTFLCINNIDMLKRSKYFSVFQCSMIWSCSVKGKVNFPMKCPVRRGGIGSVWMQVPPLFYFGHTQTVSQQTLGWTQQALLYILTSRLKIDWSHCLSSMQWRFLGWNISNFNFIERTADVQREEGNDGDVKGGSRV